MKGKNNKLRSKSKRRVEESEGSKGSEGSERSEEKQRKSISEETFLLFNKKTNHFQLKQKQLNNLKDSLISS